MSLSGLLLVLPLLGQGARIDVAGGADLSMEAGAVPQDVGLAAEPQISSTLLLLSGLRLVSERTSLVLTYRPQIYIQFPNRAELNRPLFLHQGALNYRTRLSQRDGFEAGINGEIGEVSYGSFQQSFPPNSGAAVGQIVPLARVSGNAGFAHATSARNSLSTSLSGGYRTSMNVNEAEGDTAGFPSSYDLRIDITDSYSLSRRARLSSTIGGGYIGTVEEGEVTTDVGEQDTAVFGLSADYELELSVRSIIGFTVGGALTYSPRLASVGMVPTTMVRYANVWGGDGHQWSSTVRGGVRGFLDQVSATYRTQGFAEWELEAELGADWGASLSVLGSTSLEKEPLVPENYETFASISLPFRYRISDGTGLRFGSRGTFRGPHLGSSSPESQMEVVGFVGFVHTFGSDRTGGAWLR